MKKTFLVFMFGMLAVFSVSASELLRNGNLTGNGGFPTRWTNQSDIAVQFQKNGGANGAGMLTFTNVNAPGKIVFRQASLTLVPGEKYRISVKVKTSNFKAQRVLIGLINKGWTKSGGVNALPADMDDWQEVSTELTLFDSPDTKQYAFIVFIKGMTGMVTFSDFRLTPLSETAKKANGEKSATAEKNASAAASNGSAVSVGDNLLGNGNLAGSGDSPDLWNNQSKLPIDFQNNGGPGGAGMLTSSSTTPGRILFRQTQLVLVPGEKYRVSCKVKTEHFKAKKVCIGVINNGWVNEDGIKTLPGNTNDWQEITADFVLSNSTDIKAYAFIIFLDGMTGTVSLGDLQLIPLTEKAAKGSKGQQLSGENISVFITPMVPRLAVMPAGTTSIPFAWVQKKNSDAVLSCTIDKKHTVKLTVQNYRFTLLLPEWARTGSHELHTVLYSADGKEMFSADFQFGFAPVLPKSEVKPFNNMMSEVLNVPGNRKSYDFVNPRDGWVYFRVDGSPRTTILLKGSDNPLIRPEYYHSENQRFLKAGKYTLTLDQPVSGNVIVRLVPIIYKYGPITRPLGFREAANCDLEYHRKNVFGVCNLIGKLNFSRNDSRYFQEVKERGLEWTDVFITPNNAPYSRKAQQELTDKLNMMPEFLNPNSTWMDNDEYFWKNTYSTLMCARSYEGLKNPHGKKMLNWIAGVADFIPSQIHYDIVSRFLNVSGGKGFLAYEVYFTPKTTEEEAVAYIRDSYDRSLLFTDTVSLGSRQYTGFVLGNFQIMPIISLDHRTDVDYRYYLDLQFNILAKDPKYAGLGLIGLWGCHYADQDMNDWSYALIRHYILEGHTDMLSAKYGFTYKLAHVKDGDFQKGLAEWQVNGNVKAGELFGYAAGAQRRWGGTKTGDTFALFTGVKGKANQLSQTITGLVPGKPYKLYYAVGDYKDNKAQKFNPRELQLNCNIEGAKITKQIHYVDRYNVQKRKKGSINMNYVFFTPTKTEHKLVFSDMGTVDNEQLMLNFVKVIPLYVPEK